MERIEVLQFKRQGYKRSFKEDSKGLYLFGFEEYLILILAFLMGRCELFSTGFFSSSYIGSFKKKDYMYYLAAMFSIFGIISSLNRSLILKYAAKMLERDLKQDRGAAREIELELCKFGYNVKNVEFVQLEEYFRVEIELEDGFKTPRKKEIEDIVERIAGCEVEVVSEIPKQTGGYQLCLLKKPHINVDYAIFSKSRDNINGDRVCFLQLKDGKFLACISDGMGTGKSAAENSFIVIDALKKFTDLGFDRKVAIKFINSLLSMKSIEGFASVDIVCIDRFRSTCEFLKAGAMPAFIKRGSNVFEISSSSLPVGVEATSQFDYTVQKLQKGDMIFMCSDGLFDLLGEDGHRTFYEYLCSHEFLSTQSAGKQIFEWALSSAYAIRDDVTIIVLKVGGAGERRSDEKTA
ncbi:SpoIIE family protein phosphatase [Caldicellulosiruptor morganii]|uniref:SpoIIE family protein phosphatase n=1 Tax=Caldicellulosiruptor morganii TaxID=1387555 RepID=UPI000B003AE2|nr:SpoIIE family protein phosphatase [Caldicellulosiruptor morganii]